MITRIHSDLSSYEVGKDGVESIELTNHGSKKNTMYKVTYDDGEYVFVGMLEHEREVAE